MLNLALIGYGGVARALERILLETRSAHPFRIAGIHTRTRPAAPSLPEFLDQTQADTMVELSTLNPATGEPAISHIRAAFARGMNVVTANKGPIAHAYAELRDEAAMHGAGFRFESTVMDGAPIFNQFRYNLPGVKVLGFAGVLNSTSKLVIERMEQGGSFDEGLAEARRLGIAEADASYDLEGFDSAAKTAALANVLMDARITPQSVATGGIMTFTPQKIVELIKAGKTVRLVSRARVAAGKLELSAGPEILDRDDVLASVHGTSNILLVDTDRMGTLGTVSISPQVEQTAYGVYIDLLDLLRKS